MTPRQRMERQRLNVGPVTLVYANRSIWGALGATPQTEHFLNNGEAIARARSLSDTRHFHDPFIALDETGEIIFGSPELLSAIVRIH